MSLFPVCLKNLQFTHISISRIIVNLWHWSFQFKPIISILIQTASKISRYVRKKNYSPRLYLFCSQLSAQVWSWYALTVFWNMVTIVKNDPKPSTPEVSYHKKKTLHPYRPPLQTKRTQTITTRTILIANTLTPFLSSPIKHAIIPTILQLPVYKDLMPISIILFMWRSSN